MTNKSYNKQKNKPYPSYRDSGIEWLGKIPEHWKIISCKFGYSIQLGKRLQNVPLSSLDIKVPYLKALNVQWETIDVMECSEMWASLDDIDKYSIQNNDLLVCAGGEVGRAGIVIGLSKKCIIQKAIHRVRAKEKNNVKYLMYLLEVIGLSDWFNILCNKATIANFTCEKFNNLKIILPPVIEQTAIVNSLDKETSRIDSLTEKIKKSIELLKEYRSALITSAVTGQIDVRESQEEIINVVQLQRSKKEASPLFKKTVLGAEIVAQLKDTPHFGKTKFMKTVYLCEAYLQIPLKGTYKREAAGPLDNSIYKMEGIMKRNKWFEVIKTGSMYKYKPLENSNNYKPYFDKYWGDYAEKLNQLLLLSKRFTTEQSEIVDTIYAVWNDFLIEGKHPSDSEIIDEVKNNWHERKKRFSDERLKKAIQWMKEQNFIPQGYGPKTKK